MVCVQSPPPPPHTFFRVRDNFGLSDPIRIQCVSSTIDPPSSRRAPGQPGQSYTSYTLHNSIDFISTATDPVCSYLFLST